MNCHCCPQCSEEPSSGNQGNISRRNFIAMGVMLGGLTLSGLQNNVCATETADDPFIGQAPLGTVTTHIAPDFKSDRWVGFKGKIVEKKCSNN